MGNLPGEMLDFFSFIKFPEEREITLHLIFFPGGGGGFFKYPCPIMRLGRLPQGGIYLPTHGLGVPTQAIIFSWSCPAVDIGFLIWQTFICTETWWNLLNKCFFFFFRMTSRENSWALSPLSYQQQLISKPCVLSKTSWYNSTMAWLRF